MTGPEHRARPDGPEPEPARATPPPWIDRGLPLRLFLVLLVTVSATEFLIMWILETAGDLPGHVEAVVDTLILAVVLAPLLYVFLFRPLVVAADETVRAGEALTYSERKYATLVESSLTGIFIDRDGRIAFCNQRFAEIVGRRRDEVVGLSPRDLVHPEDLALVESVRRGLLAGEPVPPELECRVVGADGRIAWVAARHTVIPYRGAPSILGNVQDVTARRRAEEAVRDSERQLRELSRRLIDAQEAERARVARDLHDGIGQSLSAIKFVIEHNLRDPPEPERRAPMVSLQSLVPKVQDAVDEVRRIAMALRPSTLDDLGLLATVRWLCREFQATFPAVGVDVRLGVTESEVPEALKSVVYRIVQEALTNVAKHSGAAACRVSLAREGGELVLRVEDDGRGLEADANVPEGGEAEGLGLGYMRERAQLSGGTFSIATADGGGTSVRVVWPLDPVTG